MSFISSVPTTAELPLWSQNLIGFGFLAILLFFIFGVLPLIERDARQKYILRNAGTLLTVMDKRADMLFFVKLYDMSVSEVLLVWFNLTHLIADHNGNFDCESDTYYSDDRKNPYALYRCIADQFSGFRLFRYFEQKKVEKFLHKYGFGKGVHK